MLGGLQTGAAIIPIITSTAMPPTGPRTLQEVLGRRRATIGRASTQVAVLSQSLPRRAVLVSDVRHGKAAFQVSLSVSHRQGVASQARRIFVFVSQAGKEKRGRRTPVPTRVS